MKDLHFKKWFVEADQKTVNIRVGSKNPAGAVVTPNQNDEKTYVYPPGYKPTAATAAATQNIIRFVQNNIDSHFSKRDIGNVSQATVGFQGTPDFSSPEEAKKYSDVVWENKDDTVIESLRTISKWAPRTKPMAQRAATLWMDFKRKLIESQYRENQDPKLVNPVIWKATAFSLRKLEKSLGDLSILMNSSNVAEDLKDSYSKFVNVWSQNYPTWIKIVEDQQQRASNDFRWPTTKVDASGKKINDIW